MRSGLPLPANAVGRRLQIRQALNRNWPRLLLSSSGRIDRASWWIASCALTIVGAIVLKLIDIFDYDRVVAATNRFSAVSVGLVLVILFVLLLYCLLAVGVKRLHDRNKRGWWVFLFLLVPVVLAFMIGALASDLGAELAWTATAIALMLGVWALIELGVLAGTAGPNRYGPAAVR
jgi:uncharacterized membrane protein YhaH (DUF805 family)